MIEVSKEEFFKSIESEEVYPIPRSHKTYWKLSNTLELVGMTTPGDQESVETGACRYYLTEDFADRTEDRRK